ncbi:cellulose biosynthesis protein BcsN [Phyllobacterium ifriqiyense]|uniref:cellulose biosynthesis protein BcsN n=1 Tax=Phyllobacterium ifriqiyense TaxID=314238 RepID=UPI0033990CB1
MVDATQAYAFPPPGGPSVVSVIERPYNNAVQQEILLSTSARTPGQNVLRIQLFGPVKPNLSGGETLRDPQLGVANIQRELRNMLPGVAMRRSPIYVQNRYGPFGFASGRSPFGDTCIYAWQRIRPSESQTRWLTGRGSIQVRLRLCDAGLSEEQLLAFMYGFTINASFSSYSWNPYGEMASPPHNLGKPGADIYAGGPPPPPAETLMPAPVVRSVRVASPERKAQQSTDARAPRPVPVGPLVPPPPLPALSGSSQSSETNSPPQQLKPEGAIVPTVPAVPPNQ